MNKVKAITKIILLIGLIVNSCSREGYPNMQFYYFFDKKHSIEKDFLQVVSTTTDTIPLKWREYAVPFDFMDDKFIYFKNNPEEILRVNFIRDSTQGNQKSNCKVSLFGLFNGNKWIFNYEISSDEKERIKKRLETEILSKMKHTYKKEE